MICAPDHRLADRRKVEPADLNGEPFVAFETGIPTRRHIDRILRKEHVRVNVAMEFDNIELLKRAVEINAGIGILPRDNIEREVAGGYLKFARFVRRDPWMRPLGILRRRGKTPGPAERMFLGILRTRP